MTSEELPSSNGYQVDVDIAVSKDVQEEDLRSRIRLIVTQIKTNRNRASYDNICDHLRRDAQYRALDKNSDVIPFIDTMVSDGHLRNTGRDKESFAVISESPLCQSPGKAPIPLPPGEIESTNVVNERNDDSHPKGPMVEPEAENNENQLQGRLDEFMNKVLDAVDNKIEERLLKFHLPNHVRYPTTPQRSSITTPRQLPKTPVEVESLREEIQHLREQLREKDKLILSLQRNNHNSNNNNNNSNNHNNNNNSNNNNNNSNSVPVQNRNK